MKYETNGNGEWKGDLADGEYNLHIYAMDIFQYGINGLDARLPSPTVAGTKRGCDDDAGGKVKRHKSDGSDASYDDVQMEHLSIDGGGFVPEEPVQGVVRIISNMKLYWYDPK